MVQRESASPCARSLPLTIQAIEIEALRVELAADTELGNDFGDRDPALVLVCGLTEEIERG